MSQQPCLPVQYRKRKHGKRGKEEPSFSDLGSMDANQYLAMVVQQASQLPSVFVAGAHDANVTGGNDQFDDDDEDEAGALTEASMGSKRSRAIEKINPTGSAAAASYLFSSNTELVPPPHCLDREGRNPSIPTCKSWADRSLDAFSRLRLYLEQVEGDNVERIIPLPPLKDRAGWHVFCVGKQEAEGNHGGYYGEDDEHDGKNETIQQKEATDDVNSTDVEHDTCAWKQALRQKDGGHFLPTTSLLLQMDQVMVRRVLTHLTYFVCEGWTVSKTRAAWLYGLAARLDRSVHRDDAVVLYRLLKRLTMIRASTAMSQRDSDDDEEMLARLNTLILIFGVYFEQSGGYSSLMEPRADE